MNKWKRYAVGCGIDDRLPHDVTFPGIYCVILDGRIMFVGEGKNVGSRLRDRIRLAPYSHTWKTSWGQFGELGIAVRRERKPFERRMAEGRLIARLSPPWNRCGR